MTRSTPRPLDRRRNLSCAHGPGASNRFGGGGFGDQWTEFAKRPSTRTRTGESGEREEPTRDKRPGNAFVAMPSSSTTAKEYREAPWLSPKVEIRPSRIHGRGMFAKEPVSKGEKFAIWGGRYVARQEADEAKARTPGVRVQQTEEDVSEVFTREGAEEDPTYFLNHSCDPNTWMDDEVTVAASRIIGAGEELTIDYAMFEADESFVETDKCA